MESERLKGNLRRYCRATPRQHSASKTRFLMSREHKIAFCSVAKAGSSTIHRHLLTLANVTVADGMGNHEMRKEARRLYLSHEKESSLRAEGLFTFLFVRHPFER